MPTIFLLEYIMRSLLARLPPLHSENVDYKRIDKLSKIGLFLIFLYTLSYTINFVTTGARKMPIEYVFFALFVANNA